MTLTNFIVVEVVRRCNFHTARAFFHVRVLIAHDRNATVNDRQNDFFTNKIFVTRIFWVNGNTGITQHGFWTCGGDHNVVFTFRRFNAISQRVAEVPHVAFHVFVFNFQIRNRGVQFWIPVHQTFTTVDQVIFVQTYKHFLNRFVEAVIHGEAFTIPVDRRTQAAQLLGDGATRLVFPFPDFVDERITAVIVLRFAFFCCDLTLNNHLSRDTGVVSTHLP